FLQKSLHLDYPTKIEGAYYKKADSFEPKILRAKDKDGSLIYLDFIKNLNKLDTLSDEKIKKGNLQESNTIHKTLKKLHQSINNAPDDKTKLALYDTLINQSKFRESMAKQSDTSNSKNGQLWEKIQQEYSGLKDTTSPVLSQDKKKLNIFQKILAKAKSFFSRPDKK